MQNVTKLGQPLLGRMSKDPGEKEKEEKKHLECCIVATYVLPATFGTLHSARTNSLLALNNLPCTCIWNF